MIIKRVDEASFHRRQWGVLEDYLNDKKLGEQRRKFIQSLADNECLALVSKNGMNVLLVRGFSHVEDSNGTPHTALTFYQMQLDRKWSLPMIQTFAKASRLPFNITNYKAFEEVFPKAKKAGEVFVKKAA